MDNSGIENVLSQLRAASATASGTKKLSASEENAASADFGHKFKAAIDQVNATQQAAGKATREFTSGESDKNLHEVMISLQKSNVSFQSMIQMRNKLVQSYQEIMRMQV